ncbi:uncharacterized protein LOC119726832 [Patiria miniata]|uniref:Endonuclease/exonuclease/phosphatase domain-containing protein n=1 Tax=Patiria miniata TaxID=46514 RepID=A0A913ZSL2_PATMI|nr:uncharacterized protein LOC119726828 [Patiria miniata]XP_038054617.1 uncharacterized protein LOC119726832 [Patiria miniata]
MNLSVVAVTETWLDSTIPDSALFETHSVFRKDRNRRGGGVLLAISNSLNPTAVDSSGFPSSIEFVCAAFTINSERWLCGAYYRPPTDAASLGLLEEVLNNLELDLYAGFILMGDFNINWSPVNPCPLKSTLQDLADSFCVDQVVSKPTGSSADFLTNTIIDLICTSRPDRVCNVSIEPGLSSSDHHMVSFRIRGSPGKLPDQVRETFQYHKADLNHFHNLLSAVPWNLIDYSDLDDAWENFSDYFLACVRECIPVRRGRKRVKPWISADLHKLILEKRRLFRRARSTGTASAWNKYKQARNKVRKSSKKAYNDFVTDLFQKKDNRKSFWSFVKSKRNTSNSVDCFLLSDGSKICDPTRIAAEFNYLFASFFSGSADTNDVTAPALDIPPLNNFRITTAQVASEIKKLFARKAHGPDGISAQMLKLACPTIIPVLTKFYK